jgi:hypothetical protein
MTPIVNPTPENASLNAHTSRLAMEEILVISKRVVTRSEIRLSRIRTALRRINLRSCERWNKLPELSSGRQDAQEAHLSCKMQILHFPVGLKSVN